jgi:hypothetical protein
MGKYFPESVGNIFVIPEKTKTSSSVELEEGMTPEPPEPNKATKKSRDADRGSVVHRGSKVWC